MTCVSTVDIGTNTIRQLIVQQTKSGDPEVLFHGGEIVRLGEGTDKSGLLSDEAMARAWTVLEKMVQHEEKFDVALKAWTATSCVRDAQNRDDFLNSIKQKYNRVVKLLSGEEEARLSYKAVHRDFGETLGKKRDLVVIDIGGGSTEYILGHGGEILSRQSLQMGAVRLTERCITQNPLVLPERNHLRTEISKQLATLDPAFMTQARDAAWVAVAGTATSLAAVQLGDKQYVAEKVHGFSLSADALEKVQTMLSGLSIEQRIGLGGLPAKRADVMPAGAAILLLSMKFFGIDELTVSDRGLRWGVVLEMLEQQPLG